MNTIKRNDMRITEVPEGEEKPTESLFKEIMAEHFSNMGEEMEAQIQEAQDTLYKISMLRHIIIKL